MADDLVTQILRVSLALVPGDMRRLADAMDVMLRTCHQAAPTAEHLLRQTRMPKEDQDKLIFRMSTTRGQIDTLAMDLCAALGQMGALALAVVRALEEAAADEH